MNIASINVHTHTERIDELSGCILHIVDSMGS